MSNKTYKLSKYGSKIEQLLNKIDDLSKDDIIGLDQVDNTSDMDKPVSTLQRQAFNMLLEEAKQYTDKEIAEFDFLKEEFAFIKIVSTLPSEGLSNRIYLVPKAETEENNLFDEYLWANDSWEWISTKTVDVDLTDFYSIKEVDKLLDGKVDKIEGKDLSTNDFTDAEKEKLAGLKNYDDTKIKESIDTIHTHDNKNVLDSITEDNWIGRGYIVGQINEDASISYIKKGEIFNDYENNKALSLNSTARGGKNISGGKGFKISAKGESYYELYAVSPELLELKSLLEANTLRYSVRLKTPVYDIGEITDVTYNEEENWGRIWVSNQPDIELETDEDDPENFSIENYLIVVDHPELGDIDIGFNAVAEGENTIASERDAHSEGRNTKAIGQYSHSEGRNTKARYCAHSEGYGTEALASYSHSEGMNSKTNGNYSHAEGHATETLGEGSHTEGYKSRTGGNYSHAEGMNTYTSAEGSHVEGYNTRSVVSAKYSHAEGDNSVTGGEYSHAEGYNSQAGEDYSHAEGYHTTAGGNYAHSEGYGTYVFAEGSHAEGRDSIAEGKYSHTEGRYTHTFASASHAEGHNAKAYGEGSHAEGSGAETYGIYSHAEGGNTHASGQYSHTEGNNTYTHEDAHSSHAEGCNTHVYGSYAHSEGYNTYANAYYSHAEGWSTEANGLASHSEGKGTIANADYQHVYGMYNIPDEKTEEFPNGKYASIVGNGESARTPSNAYTLDWDGNGWYAGDVEASAIILRSSTEGSTKKFKLTVDDSGKLNVELV